MPEFLKLLPPNSALNKLLDQLTVQTISVDILARDALGRVTTKSVTAPHPLPEFRRSTVDGFAVRAADTHGASDGLPAYLDLIGEVPMGAAPAMTLQANQCALIHTGGMLPKGADAVVMVENTQQARQDEVEIMRAVAVEENVIEVGEDISSGEEVIAPGTRLRPAEIGGLMALGITRLSVARKPRVGIISSGDEVIPPGERPEPGQVRDINAYTLRALVEQAGGVPKGYGIVPDQPDAMLAVSSRALGECDVVVITAGSSASTRDLTGEVVNQLGKPGVLVHGVNVRPGKPTILGVCDGKAVIGLPGNPVSALVIANLFVRPVISALLGESRPRPTPKISARLSINLASQTGREDWVPVRLSPQPDGHLAEPIFGKSNLIFILARADGMVRIPPEATGLGVGELVDVWLF
jgi:molybdopterin molybdotransferase